MRIEIYLKKSCKLIRLKHKIIGIFKYSLKYNPFDMVLKFVLISFLLI